MLSKVQLAFALGVKVAENVHGVSRKRNQGLTDAIFRTLQDIADQKITLLNTPEEDLASLPEPPPQLKGRPEVEALLRELAADMPKMTHQGIRDEQEIAADVLKGMPPLQ